MKILCATVNMLFLKRHVIRPSLSYTFSRNLKSFFSFWHSRFQFSLLDLFSYLPTYCLSSAVSDATLSAVFRLRTSSRSARCSGVSDCILAVAVCLRTSSLSARFSDVSNSIRVAIFCHRTTSLSARSSGVSDSICAAVFCCRTTSLSAGSSGIVESIGAAVFCRTTASLSVSSSHIGVDTRTVVVVVGSTRKLCLSESS